MTASRPSAGSCATGLATLPTSFVDAARRRSRSSSPAASSAASGGAPGGCLNDVFQSISTASYRARGVDAVIVRAAAAAAPSASARAMPTASSRADAARALSLYGLNDESWYGQLFYAARSSTAASGIDANAFVNYYDQRRARAPATTSCRSARPASYYHNFGRLRHDRVGRALRISTRRVRDDAAWSGAGARSAARYTF